VPTDITISLRAEVARRAELRCEYCLIREADTGFPHQVDHIISRKHGGLSVAENLALACLLCNRHKGSDIAAIDSDTGEVVRLFHPRRDKWLEHFQIDGEHVRSLTDVGRVTVQLLKLNTLERLSERRLLQVLGAYPVR
jgi:HNH endonuclease